ncbi:MAG: hypothetical protein ACI94Z_001904 [Yoonia sp.]|jgi:hypothetical protein
MIVSGIPLISADEFFEYSLQFCLIKDVPKTIGVGCEEAMLPSIHILMGLCESSIPEEIQVIMSALTNEQRQLLNSFGKPSDG